MGSAIDSFLSQVNWSLLFQGTVGIDECWAQFCQITNEAFSKFIPTRLCNFRINAKYLKRYDKHIRTLHNKKASAWKKWKRFSSTALRNKYI